MIKDLEEGGELDSRLCFDGYIRFLKKRREEEKTMRVKFLDFAIRHFEDRLQGRHLIGLEEMAQYGDLLELVYTSLFPALGDERVIAWALAVPVSPIIFYGTDAFYNNLRDPVTHQIKAYLIDDQNQVRTKMNMEFVYSMILQQMYGYDLPAGNSVIKSMRNQETGLFSYYRLNIDCRFIEVVPNGELPPFDPAAFQPGQPVKDMVAWLLEHLPLHAFRFEGFAALTAEDVTLEYVVESIKNLILAPDLGEDSSHHAEMLRHLNVLAGSSDLQFGLLPLLKVNGRPVYSDASCYHSVLAEAAGSDEETEDIYMRLANRYFGEPRLIFYETLPEPEPGEYFFLGILRRVGIVSYGLVPVYYNNQLSGVLEVSSRKPGLLNSGLLSRLDVVMPLLAQLLQLGIDEFDACLKAVVRENFTAIQPAVEWKFNEAAWRYERMIEQGKAPASVETIYFKEVYPLYGAIDIRNSTLERNSAIRMDLQTQFGLLTETLLSLQQAADLQLLEELLHQVQRWQQTLNGALTTVEELNLNVFLKEKVGSFLMHFREIRPDLSDLMAPYQAAVDESEGAAFRRRRELEASIQLINATVNGLLEENIASLQKSYPFYFEKFRTDGVEYDIYIGESIAPDRPFDLLYLRNLRLWQLGSMAMVARKTHGLLPELPEDLETTQLIFVHSAPIDISFRKDERRFDVEGGYNIRYQVVKKRIDKVRVRDTNERLTQPGKIAIIYFNEREVEEYDGYIRYLQEKEVLGAEVEHLELEELQGVSGLRALRVRVLWLLLALFCMGSISCRGCHRPPKADPPAVATVPSPHGYDLGAPKKTILPEPLHEISGITFLRSDSDTLYAIEDETGRLFYFHLGDGKFPSWKFGKHGDYEDVTVLDHNEFVVLRSDGSLFVFPAGMVRSGDHKGVHAYEHILPQGEYEGLYGDEGGRLIALCKNCPGDDQRDEVSGYVLQYDAKHRLKVTDHFLVEVPAGKLTSIHKKIKFHPSCIARHPLTKEWYIISSVNKVLLVLDNDWKVKSMYALDPILFKQPEGLAFDARGNMYISNEGQQGNANILYFPYRP